ncbi:hypothetical protein [Rhizobium leguminosarum]|nr:hypothetical protein [Rhizobium leguminosarum]MBP2448627.1 hypothetical protein [Rhizobium leguminosarum]
MKRGKAAANCRTKTPYANFTDKEAIYTKMTDGYVDLSALMRNSLT